MEKWSNQNRAYFRDQCRKAMTSKAKGEDWFAFMAQRDEDRCHDYSREFPYIRYPIDSFARAVSPLMGRAKSFFDIGCGGGDKLAYVKKRWPKVRVAGIEHEPWLARWAMLMFENVVLGDALEHDYGQYDVIYAYWPIADLDKMAELCLKVASGKKKSATFVLVGCDYMAGRKCYDREFTCNEDLKELKWKQSGHGCLYLK